MDRIGASTRSGKARFLERGGFGALEVQDEGTFSAPPSLRERLADELVERDDEEHVSDVPAGCTWHYAGVHVDPKKGLVYTCTSCEASASRKEVEGESDPLWRSVRGGQAVHACERKGTDAVALRDARVRRDVVRLTPVERGSFVPRPSEYVEAVLPAYVTDGESLERELELQAAKAELEEAIERRIEGSPGPAPCSNLELVGMGHRWRKVPGHPTWFCLGCGREVPTGDFDLRLGRLTRTSAVDATAIRNARAAILSGKMGSDLGSFERSAILQAAAELGVAAPLTTEYRDNERDPGICTECGCAKGLHVSEERLRKTNTDRGGVIILSRLMCPRPNVDVS